MILENTPGVLTRICEIVSNRGYNIESLNVNTFDVQSNDNKKDFKNSKITIEINMPKIEVDKLKKQLSKIIGVKYFLDFFEEDYLIRELMLLTVSFHDGLFNEESVFKIYNARIIDVGAEYIHLEVINTPEILTKFFNYLKKQQYTIVDIIRSGKIIIEKKDQIIESNINFDLYKEQGKNVELKFPSKEN
jgi:acetolactate synthase-1/3 small subunit